MDTLPEAIEDAWVGAEWPQHLLGKWVWSCMFESAGYINDREVAERPTETLTLYRGCLPEFRSGMAWTDKLDIAKRFAGRLINNGKGKVYTATVTPDRLFAYFNDDRGESEYVIETDGLDISEL